MTATGMIKCRRDTRLRPVRAMIAPQRSPSAPGRHQLDFIHSLIN